MGSRFWPSIVLGDDPAKHKLSRGIEAEFAAGKRHFEQNADITGKELYEQAVSMAKESRWDFGRPIAGHLIGQFPNERIPGDKVTLYEQPKNLCWMRDLDAAGKAALDLGDSFGGSGSGSTRNC